MSLSTKPILINTNSRDITDYFASIARTGDVLLVSTSQLSLLSPTAPAVLPVGTKRMIYATDWFVMETLKPTPTMTDIVAWNIERGTVPTAQAANLAAWVVTANGDAKGWGLPLAIVPDLYYAQFDCALFAANASILIFQGQSLQDYPSQFVQVMGGLILRAKKANSNVATWIQVFPGYKGSSAMNAYNALADLDANPQYDTDIAGIGIWTSLQTLTQTKELVNLLRP